MIFSLAVLVVATVRVWNERYETVRNRPALRIVGEEGPMIRIARQRGEREIVRSIHLPMGGEVNMLHLAFSHQALDLVEGAEKWQVGRLIVDWHDASGRIVAHDTVLSMRGSDENARRSEMVVRARDAGMRPTLRIEHLGRSGRMEINGLHVMAVNQRPGFVWLTGALVCGWGMWCFVWVGLLSEVGLIRRILAAGLMFALGWFLAVPGPWAHPRPLGAGFATGEQPEAVGSILIRDAENKTANAPEPLGEMPVQGSWLVRVKVVLSLLRPLLHVLLFAGPAFVLAVCCGYRCAWWTMVLISFAVEASQAAFWHGVDWLDGVDLLLDWVGIGTSLWVYRKCLSSYVFKDSSCVDRRPSSRIGGPINNKMFP